MNDDHIIIIGQECKFCPDLELSVQCPVIDFWSWHDEPYCRAAKGHQLLVCIQKLREAESRPGQALSDDRVPIY